MANKRKHPKFLRPNYGRSSRSRIKAAWRRPRGIDNKKRAKIKYMGASPSIGYGQPAEIRGNHPRGLPEKLVQSPADISGLEGVVVRIAGGVGRKKREEIIRLAEAAKLVVVNKAKKYPVRIAKEKKEDGTKPKAAEKKPEAKEPAAKIAEQKQSESAAEKKAAAPSAPTKPEVR